MAPSLDAGIQRALSEAADVARHIAEEVLGGNPKSFNPCAARATFPFLRTGKMVHATAVSFAADRGRANRCWYIAAVETPLAEEGEQCGERRLLCSL